MCTFAAHGDLCTEKAADSAERRDPRESCVMSVGAGCVGAGVRIEQLSAFLVYLHTLYGTHSTLCIRYAYVDGLGEFNLPRIETLDRCVHR